LAIPLLIVGVGLSGLKSYSTQQSDSLSKVKALRRKSLCDLPPDGSLDTLKETQTGGKTLKNTKEKMVK
jgi:hypothetical protein